MQTRIAGAWTGWSGDTIVKLANGTVWRQDQYYYRYQSHQAIDCAPAATRLGETEQNCFSVLRRAACRHEPERGSSCDIAPFAAIRHSR